MLNGWSFPRRVAGLPAPMLIAVTWGAFAWTGPAFAQQRPVTVPIDTVNGRARPEFDPVGIALGGGFTLFPEVAAGVVYDDNVYRVASPKRDDAYAQIRPRILIQSNSPLHPVSLEATATARRYASIETENSEQYSLTATAASEIAAGTHAALTAGYSRLLEPRGSSGDLFIGGKPITYDLAQASGTLSRDVGLFGLEIGGDLSRYDYNAVKVAGVALDQDYRDFRNYGAHARVAYAIGPSIAAFVRGEIEHSDYPKFDMLNRNSRGYNLLVGVELGLGNLFNGSFGIGYLHENFADPLFSNISGLDYNVALNWSPTTLVSVSLKGARSIERSPFEGSAGGLQTTLSAGVDYELLRQLILSADTSYIRQSFRGFDRRDDYHEAQVGARYLVNRIVSAALTLNYRRQTSAGIGARDFNSFGASVGVTLHR